jgi:hypothetical protein
MNTTDPVDLEVLRDVRDYFADRQDAEHRDGETFPTPNEEMRLLVTVDSVIAELTARRARDAEVEALVAAARELSWSLTAMYPIIEDGKEVQDAWNERNAKARNGLHIALIPFTGAKNMTTQGK